MPGIMLTLSGEPDTALVGSVVPAITTLTCEILDKRREATMALVRFVPRAFWFVRGHSLVEHDRNAFRLEVTLTDETNTKTQKARYHKEAFALLSELMGNVHEHSNIHIIDCRAAAYGYGGITQEYRHQHPND